MSSPTSLTLKQLRAEGWTVAIVEKTIPHSFIKQDMGGFADVVAWRPQAGVLAIQATSGANVSARVKKIEALESARAWLLSPARLEVWGWRKVGARGKRKLWEVRRVPMGVLQSRTMIPTYTITPIPAPAASRP